MNEVKRFNYLSSEINSVIHDTAVRMGLSDSAMAILYAICNNGEACPLNEIVSLTGVSKQTINSALRKLEAEGIVYLKTAGGRKKTVYLTGTGRELAERTAAQVIRIENEIFGSWTEAERALYLDLTQRYLEQIKEKTKELCV